MSKRLLAVTALAAVVVGVSGCVVVPAYPGGYGGGYRHGSGYGRGGYPPAVIVAPWPGHHYRGERPPGRW
jgi:hypothetical protein